MDEGDFIGPVTAFGTWGHGFYNKERACSDGHSGFEELVPRVHEGPDPVDRIFRSQHVVGRRRVGFCEFLYTTFIKKQNLVGFDLEYSGKPEGETA